MGRGQTGRRRRRRHISFTRIFKECFTLFCKPFRRASPCVAVTILVIQMTLNGLTTWLTTELDVADAQDLYFGRQARQFQCVVISTRRDKRLQAKIAKASQYLGDGIEVHVAPYSRAKICPELCVSTTTDRCARIPYYCYHAQVKVDTKVRASLQSMEINCTNNCLKTGHITHRILTKRPSFYFSYYRREPTLLATVESDERKAERLRQAINSTAVNDVNGMTKKVPGTTEDDVYGMARKVPGTIGTCYVNALPKYHPACLNNARNAARRSSNNASNATNSSSMMIMSELKSKTESELGSELGSESRSEWKSESGNKELDMDEKQREMKKISTNSMFSYCPMAEDPCEWPAVSWDVPLGFRPLSTVLIAVLSCQYSLLFILLWLWSPRILRSIVKNIMSCVSSMKDRTEKFKTNPSLQKGRYAKHKQLMFLRFQHCGESCMICCVGTHRRILIIGSKCGLVDEHLIDRMVGSIGGNEYDDSENGDEEDFDAAEAARKIDRDRKQKIWDQLVHAVSKAIQKQKKNVNLTRMNIESMPEIMNTGNEIFLTINLADNIMKNLNNSVLLSLTRLKQLFLMDNNLLSLPDMTTMLSLTLLDVDGNDLGRGPGLESCVLPKSIERIYMNRNSLTKFPECLTCLHECQWLYLAHNRLADISAAIPPPKGDKDENGDVKLTSCGLSTNLTRLVLSHNEITRLPEEIGCLCKLEELWVTQNHLLELPATLCRLGKLKSLATDENRLKQLPLEIGNLTKLVELNAHTNKLTAVPESIVDIETIETLNFCNNSIIDLPHWVGNLKTIKFLDYTKNSIPVDCAQETMSRLKKNNPYVVEAKFF